MSRRRTKAAYLRLYDDPTSLFPVGKECKPVSVTLFPNGEGEIWIQGSGGKGFRITASEGPAGLGLRISQFVGAPPMTIMGNIPADFHVVDADYDAVPSLPDASEISITQYNRDERSQAFREAYQNHKLDKFYQKYPKE